MSKDLSIGISLAFTVGGLATIGAGIGLGFLGSWHVVIIVFGSSFAIGGSITLGIGVHGLAKKAHIAYIKSRAEDQAKQTAQALQRDSGSFFKL